MGLWITKGKEDKKTCWDVEITKGDSGMLSQTGMLALMTKGFIWDMSRSRS